MSLTGKLRSNSGAFAPLQKRFIEAIQWDSPPSCKVNPPPYPSINDYALVGTAFDFWLRAFFCTNNHARESKTILNELSDFLNREDAESDKPLKDDEAFRMDNDWYTTEPIEIIAATVRDQRKLAIYEEQIYTDEFFYNCINAARLEGIYREGNFRPPAHVGVLEDLKAIARLAYKKRAFFEGEPDDYVLNPEFPVFSELLGGVDADFARGDTIFEIKATKALVPELTGPQLLAYAYFDAIEQKLMDERQRWHKVALYSARYGALGVIDLLSFGEYGQELLKNLGVQLF